MATQAFPVLTKYIGDGSNGDTFRLEVADFLQAGESSNDLSGIAGDVQFLTPNTGMALVWADESRVAAIEAAAGVKAMWRTFKDDALEGGVDPDDFPTDQEIFDLRDFITVAYGITVAQVANWFDISPAELLDWMQTHTRRQIAQKLITTWRQVT